MKNIILITTLLIFTASCNRTPAPHPEQVAKHFLTAYFSVDFEQLLPLCGAALHSDLEQSAQAILATPPQALEQRRQELAAYSFRIENVQVNRKKDSAFVTYLISIPNVLQEKESHLTLVKEASEWKVVKLL